MSGVFQVYEDKAGRWRFRLKTGRGQVVAVGEAFPTKTEAVAGCAEVERAADGATVEEVDW